MPNFSILTPPTSGTAIVRKAGRLVVPDDPIIPYIEGDGTGPDIWRASVRVFDAAVAKAFGGKKKIAWFEVPAGEKAKDQHGEWLPSDTLEAVKAYKVAIKGPLTTPVGGGIRSLNVTLRQVLDLYACVRPVRYFDGTPAPVKRPELMNVVIFRENTEDVYAGIEWARGTPQAERVIEFLASEMGKRIRPDSGIGIKPISETGSKRLVRMAIQYAIATPNLNGDYLSDACAGQVGGLGMAPGANIGDEIAFFEATHGTAPKYAGKDVINPSSVILSGVMMFRYLAWPQAADLIEKG